MWDFLPGLNKPPLKVDMDEYWHPVAYLDVIIYPCPNSDAGLTNIF